MQDGSDIASAIVVFGFLLALAAAAVAGLVTIFRRGPAIVGRTSGGLDRAMTVAFLSLAAAVPGGVLAGGATLVFASILFRPSPGGPSEGAALAIVLFGLIGAALGAVILFVVAPIYLLRRAPPAKSPRSGA